MGIDALGVVGVAAGFDERPHCLGQLRLTEMDAVDTAAENLAELPGVMPNVRLVGPVHRRLDDNRRRAMSGAGRPAVYQPTHIGRQTGHIERPVLMPTLM